MHVNDHKVQDMFTVTYFFLQSMIFSPNIRCTHTPFATVLLTLFIILVVFIQMFN